MINQDELMLVPCYLARDDKSQAPAAECCAWDAFQREFYALVGGPVRRVPAARGASDDLVQDVWVEVLDGLPRFCLEQGHVTLESWVRSIVLRLLWNYVRRRSRRHERPLAEDLAAGLLDPGPSPDAELGQMQEHELFHACITQFAKRLSERDAMVVIMRFIELKASAAIARELGVRPGCVRDFLHRVVPELRAFLRGNSLGPF